jgi:hypothetical protein
MSLKSNNKSKKDSTIPILEWETETIENHLSNPNYTNSAKKKDSENYQKMISINIYIKKYISEKMLNFFKNNKIDKRRKQRNN